MSRTIKFKKEDSSLQKVNKAYKRASHRASRRVQYVEVEYNSSRAANLYAESNKRMEAAEELFMAAERLLKEAEELRKRADNERKDVQVVVVEACQKDRWNFKGMHLEYTSNVGMVPKWKTSDYKLMVKMGFIK